MESFLEDAENDGTRETLKRIANQYPNDIGHLDAIIHHGSMTAALDEADFRWGHLRDYPPEDQRKARQERLLRYGRALELFEIEINGARLVQKSDLALKSDWSRLEEDFWAGTQIAVLRLVLRFAGLLFRLTIPGAADCCDAAAFHMFRLAYLR